MLVTDTKHHCWDAVPADGHLALLATETLGCLLRRDVFCQYSPNMTSVHVPQPVPV